MIMAKNRSVPMIGWAIAAPTLLSLACLIGGRAGTALPPQRPADFEVQTATPTTNARLTTVDLEATELDVVTSMADAPTHTPDPNAVPTQPPPPTATLVPLAEPTLTLTPTSVITATSPLTEAVVAAPPPRPAATPDPPLQGGDWDFESDFIPWPNPFGEPCPGARVASGWTAFVEQGEYGSSCMNENLYRPNVFSGLKSQEITFDFIAANSGVFRTIPVKEGHRYNIMAFGKHDHSLAVVELFLGVDLTGGTIWNAETVQWFPWDSGAEDAWLPTEETVTATGEAITIFVRGIHPLAEQGGKTVIDNVSVTDLGP
jgi:hypothetical protein